VFWSLSLFWIIIVNSYFLRICKFWLRPFSWCRFSAPDPYLDFSYGIEVLVTDTRPLSCSSKPFMPSGPTSFNFLKNSIKDIKTPGVRGGDRKKRRTALLSVQVKISKKSVYEYHVSVCSMSFISIIYLCRIEVCHGNKNLIINEALRIRIRSVPTLLAESGSKMNLT
jgi:hypothetical protein